MYRIFISSRTETTATTAAAWRMSMSMTITAFRTKHIEMDQWKKVQKHWSALWKYCHFQNCVWCFWWRNAKICLSHSFSIFHFISFFINSFCNLFPPGRWDRYFERSFSIQRSVFVAKNWNGRGANEDEREKKTQHCNDGNDGGNERKTESRRKEEEKNRDRFGSSCRFFFSLSFLWFLLYSIEHFELFEH